MNRIKADALNNLKNIHSDLQTLQEDYNRLVIEFNDWTEGKDNEARQAIIKQRTVVLATITEHNRVVEEQRNNVMKSLEGLNEATEAYNDEAEGSIDSLYGLSCNIQEKANECDALMNDIQGEAEDYFAERSEKWQESENGESYGSFMEAMDFDIEIPGEPTFVPLRELGEDDLEIGDNGLVEEELFVVSKDDVEMDDLDVLEEYELNLDELEALIDSPNYKDY